MKMNNAESFTKFASRFSISIFVVCVCIVSIEGVRIFGIWLHSIWQKIRLNAEDDKLHFPIIE